MAPSASSSEAVAPARLAAGARAAARREIFAKICQLHPHFLLMYEAFLTTRRQRIIVAPIYRKKEADNPKVVEPRRGETGRMEPFWEEKLKSIRWNG